MSLRHQVKWSELSTARKTFIVVAATVQITLALCAWFDLARRPADQVRGSKKRWVPIIAMNTVGPLSYCAFGRKKSFES